MDSAHRPVLVAEVVELLSGAQTVIDATVGVGGHAEALLNAGVSLVVGIDRDESALRTARARLAPFGVRFRGLLARFSHIAEVAQEAGLSRVGGVLYDLGVSSIQLDTAVRGFSYRLSARLDMRMGDQGERSSAAAVVNTYSEQDLGRIIRDYGEERYWRRIARAIVRRRPITTTEQLASVVAGAVPRRRGGPHPARRTFQAIRIEVNEELDELAASLPQAVSLLERAGRLAIISYHSLEDRISKRFIAADPALSSLTRKPIRPSPEEVALNPRSRSARLRAAERVAEEAA